MNKVKIVCRALIISDQNKVLFVKKTNSDFWSLPGGKLDIDDASLKACLVRELQEELGVEVGIKGIFFVQELFKNDTRYIELIWEATLLSDLVCVSENIFEISTAS